MILVWFNLALSLIGCFVAMLSIRRYWRLRALFISTYCVRAVMSGHRVIVTQAPKGMTLAEAQREVDKILAEVYPPVGRA